MNPKPSDRISIPREPRLAQGAAANLPVYSRYAPGRPGHYIIRLRLQHSQSRFRPRLKFL